MSRVFLLLIVLPLVGWGITLPHSTVFPMRVGMSGELTNTKEDVLRWEVKGFSILDNEDLESDVRIEWRLSHKGSVSFSYTLSFVVTLEGEVYLDALSDGIQKRSFFPSLILLNTNQFVENDLGEGIALKKPVFVGRLKWGGKKYTDIVSATLVFGNHHWKIFFSRSLGLIGIDGKQSYFLK
ncbi:hypothetical protein [Thermospira aquatica]|uniref:DUF4390 domain-containing protein n=1 Tax=Thermospira aquatica TaxID=2828656 RepID=A0AAX3BGV6_9SPIR|nr:hypothetical protein [Thermospira aquatica]URA10681.1 hypothetical protein KDW03_02445 [Thermospira aquatica]